MSKSLAPDFIGKKINSLLILSLSGVGRNREQKVIAVCDCGTQKEFTFCHIYHGRTTSCGCYKTLNILSGLNTKHGLSGHPLFRVWKGLKNRCYNKKNPRFKDYGGANPPVTVCKEWLKDFQPFYDWAIANGWKEGLSLDRFPNNRGKYEPENCRWATQKQQMNNIRNNITVLLHDKKYTLSQICDKYPIKRNVLLHRLKQGWSIYRILKTYNPLNKTIFSS